MPVAQYLAFLTLTPSSAWRIANSGGAILRSSEHAFRPGDRNESTIRAASVITRSRWWRSTKLANSSRSFRPRSSYPARVLFFVALSALRLHSPAIPARTLPARERGREKECLNVTPATRGIRFVSLAAALDLPVRISSPGRHRVAFGTPSALFRRASAELRLHSAAPTLPENRTATLARHAVHGRCEIQAERISTVRCVSNHQLHPLGVCPSRLNNEATREIQRFRVSLRDLIRACKPNGVRVKRTFTTSRRRRSYRPAFDSVASPISLMINQD